MTTEVGDLLGAQDTNVIRIKQNIKLTLSIGVFNISLHLVLQSLDSREEGGGYE